MQDTGEEEGGGVDGGARDSLVERLFALAAKQGTGGTPGNNHSSFKAFYLEAKARIWP